MSRRSGQINPLGKRKWGVRVFIGRDGRGRRRYHNRTIHGTKKDADRYLTKVLRDRDLGQFIEPSRQALSSYLEEWAANSAARRLSKRTLLDYVSLLELHVIPALGDRPLAQVTPSDIDALYGAMQKRGLSARTVRLTHSVLHRALEHAVKLEFIIKNPAHGLDLPKQRKREMKVLSAAQLRTFLQAAAADRWFPLWQLLAATGLRPGEALGLKWADFDGARIRVQRNLVRFPDGTWELKDPKTPHARRTVTIPKVVEETLQQHRRQQLRWRLRLGAEYDDQDLVFAANNGNPLDWRLLVQRYFKPIIRRSGLPRIRPYDLRHTSATLLLAAGENVKVVSERLGHSSAALTLDVYSHVLPDMQERAAERMDALLRGTAE